MNLTFKTTAIAILVALGITACGSSGNKGTDTVVQPNKAEQSAKPVTPNQASKPSTSEQAAKPSTPDQATKPSTPSQPNQATKPDTSDQTAKPANPINNQQWRKSYINLASVPTAHLFTDKAVVRTAGLLNNIYPAD